MIKYKSKLIINKWRIGKYMEQKILSHNIIHIIHYNIGNLQERTSKLV